MMALVTSGSGRGGGGGGARRCCCCVCCGVSRGIVSRAGRMAGGSDRASDHKEHVAVLVLVVARLASESSGSLMSSTPS